MIKKVFNLTTTGRVVAVISLLLLTVVVVLLGLGIVRQLQLDASSQDLAITATQTALAGDLTILMENGSRDWQRAMSEQSLRTYLDFVTTTLGPLQSLQSISGSAAVPLLFVSAEIPRASYTLELVFGIESAEANIDMLWQEESWRITDFVVVSTLLQD